MNHIPSNSELSTLKIHLLSALDGCRIRRYEYDARGVRGNILQTIAVPLKYGHKTRQVHEAVQFNKQIVLPCMSVTMTGMSLDDSRNEGKKADMVDRGWQGNDKLHVNRKPVPVNMDFNLAIVTTKGSDLEEILAHYLSVFNPYIQLSWREPHTDKEVISKVTWDGSVSMDLPTDTDSKSKIRYIANLGLTLEGWYYRADYGEVGLIKKIEYNLGYVEELDCGWYRKPNMEQPDTVTLKAQPSIHSWWESCYDMIEDGEDWDENHDWFSYDLWGGGRTIIDLQGESMENIDSIFITPRYSDVFPVTAYDPFGGSASLSADNPAFDGIKLDSHYYNGDGTVSIVMPDDVIGEVDVILMNKYTGLSRLSETSLSGCSNKYIGEP